MVSKRCACCGSSTTGKKSMKKGGGPDWYRYGNRLDDLWQCRKCYNKENKRTETGGLVRAWQSALKGTAWKKLTNKQHNVRRAVERRTLNPSMRRYTPMTFAAPKRCAECGSYNTNKNLKGAANWYRLEVPVGPIGYLDNNCYRKRARRLKREAKGLRLFTSRKGETHSETE